jgi:hypothetical protein
VDLTRAGQLLKRPIPLEPCSKGPGLSLLSREAQYAYSCSYKE